MVRSRWNYHVNFLTINLASGFFSVTLPFEDVQRFFCGVQVSFAAYWKRFSNAARAMNIRQAALVTLSVAFGAFIIKTRPLDSREDEYADDWARSQNTPLRRLK